MVWFPSGGATASSRQAWACRLRAYLGLGYRFPCPSVLPARGKYEDVNERWLVVKMDMGLGNLVSQTLEFQTRQDFQNVWLLGCILPWEDILNTYDW